VFNNNPGTTGRPKLKYTVDLREGRVAITRENSAPLTLHLSTDDADVTLIAGIHTIRQLRQILAGADGQFALPSEVFTG
jgi:hypothetical protein